MTKLWSQRWSVARGEQFVLERECDDDTAAQWKAIFEKDEPDVLFIISKIKPKRL